MKHQSPVDFETLLADSLQTAGLEDGGLPFSSDAAFLEMLNQRLDQVTAPADVTPFWIRGIWRGVAAAAAGVILFAGLNIIPPLLFRASLSGAGMVREKIIAASVQQEIAWQQFVAVLKTQTNN